jgi:FkbM family methyltransferase
MMTMVFDIGMYDGADTAYYLTSGYQVVAVEANPELVDTAKRRFEAEIASGDLTCVHAAISPDGKAVDLHRSGQDLGSSSLSSERIADKRPLPPITVPGITLEQLFERYGVPHYLKVDIEGADRLCVLPLTSARRPTFLSFEIGEDFDDLLSHIASIGYRRFKIINQTSFRELANQRCVYDRVAYRLIHHLGYRDPRLVRRKGRFFALDHSSGPVPWQSDGSWSATEATRSRFHKARASNALTDWYDLHATVD